MTDDDLIPRHVSREPTLFQQALPELLKSVDVSLGQAQDWRQRGWLSFQLGETIRYDECHYEELRFIKSLVDSGIGEIIVQQLLQSLKPPYSYCARSVAYCFGRGEWVRIYEAPNTDEIVEENFDTWLSALADAGDFERLQEIARHAQLLAASASASANDGEESP